MERGDKDVSDSSPGIVSEEQKSAKELDFKSEDIVKVDGEDYFVNVDQHEIRKKQNRAKRREKAEHTHQARRSSIERIKRVIKWPFETKRNAIISTAVAVVIVGGIAAFLIITGPKDRGYTAKTEVEVYQDQDKENAKNISELMDQALAEYDKNNIDSYFNVCKKIEKLISEIDERDTEKIISMKAQYAGFVMRESDDMEKVLSIMEGTEELATTDYEKSLIYNTYIGAYLNLGKANEAKEYMNKVSELNLPSDDELTEPEEE